MASAENDGIRDPAHPVDERNDRLADRLADLDDRIAGHASGSHAPIHLTDSEEIAELADHLDVILRLRTIAEQDRVGNESARESPCPTLGRFRIVHEIGRGGCAIVYKAEDPLLHRHVALKVIRPDALIVSGRERIIRESQLAAKLNHSHVVTVHEVGDADGLVYIAEELCTGGSLAEWLESHPGPLPARLAAEIVQVLAEAVAFAHEARVLHRDITPGNVLLAADPRGLIDIAGRHYSPKLADFGLAVALAEEGSDATSRFTRPRPPIGTPAWMSPEQIDPAEFGPVGRRTDIYALGLLLERLLTGVAPHTGRSAAEIYRALSVDEPTAIEDLAPNLPPDILAVARKARAKRREHRYRLSAELAEDLARFLAGRPTVARPRAWLERRLDQCRQHATAMSVSAAIALACITTSALVWQHLQTHHRQDLAKSKEQAEVGRLAFDLWRQGNVATALERVITPDLAGSLPARWLRARTHAEEARLIDRANPESPFAAEQHELSSIGLSPDGSVGVGGADGMLFILAPGATAPTVAVQAHDEVNDVAFSPDGRIVATFGQDGAVRLWRTADGMKVGETGSGAGVFGVAFAPAGDRIAWGGRNRTVEIQALASDGTPVGPITLREPFGQWSDAAPAPDTQALVFLDDDTIAAASGATMVILRVADGQPLRTLEHGDGSIGDLILSADRSLLVTIGTGRVPYLWQVATGALRRRLPRHPAWVQGCDISPDGTEIVTGCRDGVIRVFAATTGEEQARFIGHAGRTGDVKWAASDSILSSGADGSLRRWARHSRPATAGFREDSLPNGPVTGVAPIGPPGDWLVTSVSSPAVLFSGPRGPYRETAQISFDHPSLVASTSDRCHVVVFNTTAPGDEPLAVGTTTELISLTAEAGGVVARAPTPVPVPQSLACLPDGAALAGFWPHLAVWRTGNTSPLELGSFSLPIDHLAVTEAGGLRVAAAIGTTIVVLPCRSDGLPDVGHPRTLVRGEDTPGNAILDVAWSPDGLRIAYGIRDREVRVIDAVTGSPIGSPLTLGGVAVGIIWSADGRSLVVADRDSVRLCDAQAGITLDEVRPGWPITSIGLDESPGRSGTLVIAGGYEHGRILRLDLGDR